MIELIMTLLLSVSPALPTTNGLTFTFDDGPTKHTVKILNVLKKHKIKAVFCIPAGNLYNKKALKTAKRAMREGHIICNHSLNHPNFQKLTKAQQARQFSVSQRIFKAKLGIKPKYFRPPFGAITRYMYYLMSYHGMKMLYWGISPSLDSRDWSPKTSAYQIYTRIIRHWIKLRKKCAAGKCKPQKNRRRGIVLFHDTNWRTASIIEKIIVRVKKGYKIKKSSYK